MTRDQQIATLVLLGWEPISSEETGRSGIYNPGPELGYVATPRDMARNDRERIVKRIERPRVLECYTPCDWVAVTDWHLEVIARDRGWIQR